ncbi:MAG: hypothetical protein K6T17_02835 [Fimbriimonadales bacterium]|nr:hypothetical protein [Fimbriimonadales bacterium]
MASDTRSEGLNPPCQQLEEMAQTHRPPWTLLVVLTAAAVGLGAFTAVYLRRLKERSSSVDQLLDQALEQCRAKILELESLLPEAQAAS